MTREIRSRIENGFVGFNDGAIFKLTNGQVWQQVKYRYWYRYKYRPEVRIYAAGGETILEVVDFGESVPVRQVSVITEGTIVSDFTGFSGDSIFEFQNGQVWQQATYKYHYHYAYRPHAIVVDGINGREIHIDGVGATVLVRRVS